MDKKKKETEKLIREQMKRDAMKVHPKGDGLKRIQKKIADKKKKEGK